MLSRAIELIRRTRAMARVRYFGLRHWCPFCRSSLRKMLPFGLRLEVFEKARVVGGGYRENVLCPVCSSTDRERLLFFFVKQRTSVFERPTRMLHFAPEQHLRQALASAQGISYWSADLLEPKVDVRLDITQLPFRRNSFDAIICSHVLEHVTDDAQAMRELYAVLRPRGQAIIQVPIALGLSNTHEDPSIKSPEDRENVFGQNDHVRLYALDVVDRLKRAGFSVQTQFLAKDRGAQWAERVRVNPEEPVFLCERAS